MGFALSEEQAAFVRSMDNLLGAAGVPAIARAWGDGDTAAGRKLWDRLANLGVHALCVPKDAGGLSTAPIDMVGAFERLGRHLVPVPYVESVVVAPALLRTAEPGSPRRSVDVARRLFPVTAKDRLATLQVHGAIGYTLEHDLGLWITKGRALVGTWGSTAEHHARVLAAITAP